MSIYSLFAKTQRRIVIAACALPFLLNLLLVVAYQPVGATYAPGRGEIFQQDYSEMEVTTDERLVSLVSINGARTDSANDESRMTAISADGRFIAFTSLATDLVPGASDTNGAPDVFLHDRLTNITSFLSRKNSSNFAGNGPSGRLGAASTIGISADGRFVVYESQASDLVSFDNNGVSDIFLFDRESGSTRLVSFKSTDFTASANGPSIMPAISANGQIVVFSSTASDLAASSDTNGKSDVYAHNCNILINELVSANMTGSNGGNDHSSVGSGPFSISDDGRYVAFDSDASDLVPNDTNGGGALGTDVFVRDLQNSTTVLASINSAGTGSGNLNSFGSSVRISGNGRFAVFASNATDLVTGITDANGGPDIFIRDLLASATSIVSINLAGNASGLNLSQFPAVSDDGRFVAFTSRASDLVPMDTNNGLEGGGGISDVFVRDTQAGITELVSINSANIDSGNSSSSGPVEISADGRYVLFASNATNLTNISDTNNNPELLLRDLQRDSTTLVTVNTFGSASGVNTTGFSLGDTNQVIAFESESGLLTNSDTNGTSDVFISGPSPPGLSVSDATVTEGDSGTTDAVFTVTLTDGPPTGNVTATAITLSGSAGAGTDFQSVSLELTFTPGETTKTVSVPVFGDLIYERSEMFTVELRDVGGSAVIDGIGVGTIIDNEQQPTLSINDVTIIEGDAGMTNAIFTITLSGQSEHQVSCGFSVANGTAVEQEDFGGVGGGVLLAPGSTTRLVNVPIIGDTITEPNETFFLNLTDPNGATISDNQGVGTIIDDESASEPATLQFTALQHSVAENGSIVVEVTRSGDLSAPATVEYATISQLGDASERSDYTSALGRLRFGAGETSKMFRVFITDDVFVEGNERFLLMLSNPTGGSLGSPANAVVLIVDNDTAPPSSNPADTAGFFVRQHYVDFLNREPDAAGLAFWSDQITSCGTDTACTELRRINVSAAFFLSIEFQQTGYLVYRMYKAAYGNLSGTPVPVRLNEFLPDTQQIARGVVVGQSGWEQVLENNKQAFAADFVARARFTNAYPTTLTPTEFVNALFTNAGVTPSDPDREPAINEFGTATDTTNAAARARALRRVSENSTLAELETNRAFVLMQYFGYLRRNPNDAPEPGLNFDGYNFWLGKLNQFGGNFVNAEMVKAFILSGEYRQRFGP